MEHAGAEDPNKLRSVVRRICEAYGPLFDTISREGRGPTEL